MVGLWRLKQEVHERIQFVDTMRREHNFCIPGIFVLFDILSLPGSSQDDLKLSTPEQARQVPLLIVVKLLLLLILFIRVISW